MKQVIRSLGVAAVAAHALLALEAVAQEAPEVFSNYLELGTSARGQMVVVEPPKEINRYVAKVEEAARAVLFPSTIDGRCFLHADGNDG